MNDKSQGSVVTCLRYGRLFSNHFTTDLLLSFVVKEGLKFVNIGEFTGTKVASHALCSWALSCMKMKNLPSILVQYEQIVVKCC